MARVYADLFMIKQVFSRADGTIRVSSTERLPLIAEQKKQGVAVGSQPAGWIKAMAAST